MVCEFCKRESEYLLGFGYIDICERCVKKISKSNPSFKFCDCGNLATRREASTKQMICVRCDDLANMSAYWLGIRDYDGMEDKSEEKLPALRYSVEDANIQDQWEHNLFKHLNTLYKLKDGTFYIKRFSVLDGGKHGFKKGRG